MGIPVELPGYSRGERDLRAQACTGWFVTTGGGGPAYSAHVELRGVVAVVGQLKQEMGIWVYCPWIPCGFPGLRGVVAVVGQLKQEMGIWVYYPWILGPWIISSAFHLGPHGSLASTLSPNAAPPQSVGRSSSP